MKSSATVVAIVLGLCLALMIPDAGLGQRKQGVKGIVARGKMLVDFGGCNDCHTPKIMTPKGPVFDTTKTLSGHPADDKIPPVPSEILGPGKWLAVTSGHMTAWAGPWGVSYTANLTPEPNTGLGKWTEAMFIRAMRTGKHLGEGRQILPPMPYEAVASLPDTDLKAIFAYLRSIKPIQNAVPDPLPPVGGGTH